MKRVLLVEDDPRLWKAVDRSLVLMMPELLVKKATTRKEAMSKLDGGFACLIVDVCLGPYAVGPDRNVDGVAVLLEARARAIGAPAILTTGMLDFAESVKLEGLGVMRVLEKPFSIHELVGAVRQAVSGEVVAPAPLDKPLATFDEEHEQRKLEHVRRVLESNGWSKCGAAKRLKVDRRTIDRYVEKLAEGAPPVRPPERKKA